MYHRWKGFSQLDLNHKGWEAVDWTGFMWYRLENSGKALGSTVKKCSGSIKGAKFHY
jgi:hypothetical protein